MDLVLVGLPGSGKTAVGRRVAARHGATFIDLDDEIERAAGASVPEIFADEPGGAGSGHDRLHCRHRGERLRVDRELGRGVGDDHRGRERKR